MANEIAGKRREAIVVTLCPAIFDRYIPSFDIADLLQPMGEIIDFLVRSAVGRSPPWVR